MFVASTVAGVSGCPMKLPPAGTGAAEPGWGCRGDTENRPRCLCGIAAQLQRQLWLVQKMTSGQGGSTKTEPYHEK